jgi:glycosyltransferase involved in cell wall biosynthesis
MKRVLIISYYWPPNGGAGVQRWLRISKYLPQHGWKPVVYTPENPELVQFDPQLQQHVHPDVEVIKRKIKEPYFYYKWFTGRDKDVQIHTGFLAEKEKTGWKEELALFIRSNFFVPDARVWWVRPSIRYLKKYLQDNPVDAIVSTGPPHSMHLIGLALKRTLGIPWIADMRDPWTDIDFYSQLNLSNWADAKHHRMEHAVLSGADHVVSVGWDMAEGLRNKGAGSITVIPNGYDPSDVPVRPPVVDNEFSLVHVGSASPTRNAPELWNALGRLCAETPDFKEKFILRFVGPVDHTILRSIKEAGLSGNTELIGQLPHSEAIAHMQKARVLLLLLNDTDNAKGILTSKLFEYLSTRRPILCIGHLEGDVAKVLNPPHIMVDRNPVDERMLFAIKRLFIEEAIDIEIPEEFSRETAARKFAELFDSGHQS